MDCIVCGCDDVKVEKCFDERQAVLGHVEAYGGEWVIWKQATSQECQLDGKPKYGKVMQVDSQSERQDI